MGLPSRNVVALCSLLLLAAGLRKSNQHVKVMVSPNATAAVKRGVRRLQLDKFNVPFVAKNSWIQLGLLLLTWRLQYREPEPTRREALSLKHTGGDQVILDWFVPDGQAETRIGTPIVVYIPGITGRLKEAVSFVQRVNAKGWTAVVYHRRGHESSLRKATFNIFGSAADLKIAVDSIRAGSPRSPIALVGSSAGSAVMVRYLGQYGDQANVACGVGLSPGYDIERMWKRIEGTFFDRYLVARLKEFFLERNRELLSLRNKQAVEKLERAGTVQEFAQHACVFAGEHVEDADGIMHHTYEEWLEITCPLRVANKICVPTLCLNALDDPICHRGMVEEIGTKLPDTNMNCALVVTDNGSHCAHQSFPAGSLIPENWGHTVALDFIAGVLGSE